MRNFTAGYLFTGRVILYTGGMNGNDELRSVLAALRGLRLPPSGCETGLQDRIETALTAAGVSFTREAPIARGSRIDFITAGGVGIEVKRGRPVPALLTRQLTRYARSGRIGALVLVAERLTPTPAVIAGVPCVSVSLRGNWGVAL